MAVITTPDPAQFLRARSAAPVRNRGLGLARVDGMGFFICGGGDVGFMAGGGRDVWAGCLMGAREGGQAELKSMELKTLINLILSSNPIQALQNQHLSLPQGSL